MLLCTPTVIRLKCPPHGVFSLEQVSEFQTGRDQKINEDEGLREQGVKVARAPRLWKFVDNPLHLLSQSLTFRPYPQILAVLEGFEG